MSCKTVSPLTHLFHQNQENTTHVPLSSTPSILTQTLQELRDQLIVVCIGVFEALDYLQEQLQLSHGSVKRLKSKLIKVIELYYQDAPFPTSKTIVQKINDSQVWTRATMEDITTFVHWICSVVQQLHTRLISTAVGIYRQIIIFFHHLPGVASTKQVIQTMYSLLEDIISVHTNSPLTQQVHSSHPLQPTYLNSIEDAPLTAVLLDYKEKEMRAPLPRSMSRKIHRMMHFQVSLNPFEATVVLPPHISISTNEEDIGAWENSLPDNVYVAITPRSIPVSPLSRNRVETAFSNFSDDVLYQARDQLRRERAETLAGQPQPPVPTFNPHDCHEDILLSCGYHSASKLGSGLYRTCRGTMPIPANCHVYFQFSIALVPQHATDSTTPNGICIGLSTKEMPLNTLVGTWKHSLGFYSSGHIIVGSQWQNYVSVKTRYSYGNTIGVLVYIDTNHIVGSMVTVRVQFSIDGRILSNGTDQIPATELTIPQASILFPTITLYATDTLVTSRFAAGDLLPYPEELVDNSTDIFCLDGLKIKN